MTLRLRRRTRFYTWAVPPPVTAMDPAAARRWLARGYPWAASLCGMEPHLAQEARLRGSPLAPREVALARHGLRLLALDVQVLTEAAGRALSTGRTVRIGFEPERLGRHGRIARALRAVAKYERANPCRGLRGPLRRGVEARERLAEATPR